MLTYDDLKDITERAAELYPRGDEEAWWAARGLDYEGLRQFCLEDGLDSLMNVLPAVDSMHRPTIEALLAGGFAMTTEIGFLLGWIACERAKGTSC